MRISTGRRSVAALAALGLAIAACGSDGDEPAADDTGPVDESSDEAAPADEPAESGEVPTVVVTTNILGDVIQAVVGDAADVVTIMPVGADPHDFQASAQEVDTMMNADALIVNGADFEEGLLDVIESAGDEGVPTFEAISAVSRIDFGEGGHDHEDEDHDHEDEGEDHDHEDEGEDHDHEDEGEDHDHEDEGEDHDHEDEGEDHDHEDEGEDHDHEDEGEDHDHDHDHSGVDPHFFTDPARMADAVAGIVDFLQETVEFVDPAAVDASADAYLAELDAADTTVAESVAAIPEANRVLVTNHEVFGYFADRYGFEIVGVVVPGGSTTDSASAGELAELASVVEAEGVPAIFADTSSSDELAQTLAAEVGGVAVVELFTESLGPPDSDGATYLDMVRTNGRRIAEALS